MNIFVGFVIAFRGKGKQKIRNLQISAKKNYIIGKFISNSFQFTAVDKLIK